MKKFLRKKFVIISIIVVLGIIYVWSKKNNFSNNEVFITENIEEEKGEEKKDESLGKNEETIEQNEEMVNDSENEENNMETENKILVYVTG